LLRCVVGVVKDLHAMDLDFLLLINSVEQRSSLKAGGIRFFGAGGNKGNSLFHFLFWQQTGTVLKNKKIAIILLFFNLIYL
jgi:hypothetical protein